MSGMRSKLSQICRLCTVQRHVSGSSTTMNNATRWRPLACLGDDEDTKIALIILNQPLDSLYPHLVKLWKHSVLKAAADGGANRLCEFRNGNQLSFIPDLISGDFDSVRPEVLLYCKGKGCKVVETPDQNFTDFTKSLRLVLETLYENKQEVDRIVALGAFGGRQDQVFANINTLFDATELTDIPVYLIADDSLACLLRPGNHVLEVNTGFEAEWCGLVPIGGRCKRVTTTGLKYNLDHQSMQFGALISTSNAIAKGATEVTVQTDQPLLWTMGIKPLLTVSKGEKT